MSAGRRIYWMDSPGASMASYVDGVSSHGQRAELGSDARPTCYIAQRAKSPGSSVASTWPPALVVVYRVLPTLGIPYLANPCALVIGLASFQAFNERNPRHLRDDTAPMTPDPTQHPSKRQRLGNLLHPAYHNAGAEVLRVSQSIHTGGSSYAPPSLTFRFPSVPSPFSSGILLYKNWPKLLENERLSKENDG